VTRLLRGGQVMATLDDEGLWQTDNASLRQVLTNLMADTVRSGADPDLERTIAETAADALGPSWTVEGGDPSPFDPDVIY
jgi:hypothetical protein